MAKKKKNPKNTAHGRDEGAQRYSGNRHNIVLRYFTETVHLLFETLNNH